MKCQSLFSGKTKKYFNISSAENFDQNALHYSTSPGGQTDLFKC